jgi:hypothetical protein
MARPRSSRGKSAVIRAKLLAMINALPAAWVARKKINCPALCAAPAKRALSAYRTKPARNSLPTPKRSESLPQG